jgi:hypothetical protein
MKKKLFAELLESVRVGGPSCEMSESRRERSSSRSPAQTKEATSSRFAGASSGAVSISLTRRDKVIRLDPNHVESWHRFYLLDGRAHCLGEAAIHLA